jgi:hypothetical protein
VRRDRIAIDSLGLFCIPFDEAEAIVDFAERFSDAFAVLARDQFRKCLPVVPDKLVGAVAVFDEN